MKMHEAHNEYRKELKKELKSLGGLIISCRWAGTVFAAIPAVNSPNCKFIRIAVAQCDFKDDKFKRKYGEYLALVRLFDYDQYISLPLNGRCIEGALKDFTEAFL